MGRACVGKDPFAAADQTLMWARQMVCADHFHDLPVFQAENN
jgi:hypothetical protein